MPEFWCAIDSWILSSSSRIVTTIGEGARLNVALGRVN